MQLQKEVVHYPTLKTILAIEEVVKKANNPVSRNQILARLQTGVMRSTLNLALDYMEKRGMVLETKKGFIWAFNPSKKLENVEKESLGAMKGKDSPEILAIKRRIEPTLRSNDVKKAAVFGSFATGTAGKNSDVDILVEFTKPKGLGFVSLKLALEKKLKRRVDLLTYASINPHIRDSILKEAVEIL
jgi:predicted nucleotidyltransferase